MHPVPGTSDCHPKILKLLSLFQKTTYTLTQPQNLHKLVKSAWYWGPCYISISNNTKSTKKETSHSSYTSTENVFFCGIGTRYKRLASSKPTLFIPLPIKYLPPHSPRKCVILWKMYPVPKSCPRSR